MSRVRGWILLMLIVVLPVTPAVAAEPSETFEPGTGKFLIVLVDGATDAPDRKTGKKPNEPNLAEHGGKLLAKKGNSRLVKLPVAAVKALRKVENVAYIQRIWLGESLDTWDTDLAAEAPRIQTDMDTDLTWETGQYLYDGSGNIRQIGDDEYSYDSAGRLIRSKVKGVEETYRYDSFGNLVEKSRPGVTRIINVDGTSNRLTGETYDVAGNVTTEDGAHRYSYDAMNMMDSVVEGPAPAKERILYGPDDERIGVIVDAGLARWKLRDFDGRVLREFRDDVGATWHWVEDYVHGGGRILGAERESLFLGRRHMHTDHLGSVRLMTTQDRTRISNHDFYPFGEEQTDLNYEYTAWIDPALGYYGDARPEPMKYTGHERDFHGPYNWPNSDYLDYMHARYYTPNLGRFLSVDPGDDVDHKAPQSWNKYSYVRNNPINATDPSGMFTINPYNAIEWFADGMQELANWTDSLPGGRQSQLREVNGRRTAHDQVPYASFDECRAAGQCFELEDLPIVVGGLRRPPRLARTARLWEVTKVGTDRVVRSKFGKIYRHRSTRLWWSRDKAGHGDSAWKVFEETPKGLRHIYDADKYGNFIKGKHKGPTGEFIPWNDVSGSSF